MLFNDYRYIGNEADYERINCGFGVGSFAERYKTHLSECHGNFRPGLIGENEQVIAIRDGIKINRRNGMAEDEKNLILKLLNRVRVLTFRWKLY